MRSFERRLFSIQMVAEVHDQAVKAPVRDHALHVCIRQEVIEVGLRDRVRPIRDDPVGRPAVAGEALDVGMEKLIQADR